MVDRSRLAGHIDCYTPHNIDAEFIPFRGLFVTVNELEGFSYIRETTFATDHRGTLGKRNHRERPLFGCQHAIIGYACVERYSAGRFQNLVWWHKNEDCDVKPIGVYGLKLVGVNRNDKWMYGPCEGVHPDRVLSFFVKQEE